MALISATQSEAVCSAFCNVTLGLAIHAMFNVADGTLSALFYAFCNLFSFLKLNTIGIKGMNVID